MPVSALPVIVQGVAVLPDKQEPRRVQPTTPLRAPTRVNDDVVEDETE